jgi:hypothetical protein
VYGQSGISNLALPHDAFKLAGAYVSYASNGGYSAFVTSVGRATLQLSKECLSRNGVMPTCDQVTTDLKAFISSAPGVTAVGCTTSGDGCLCGYTIESDAAGSALNGKFSVDGTVITHYAGTDVLPSKVDFCVQGDSLTLWGHERTNIMDMPGVRTLMLQRIVCGNSVVEKGEQCDPPNASTCDSDCQLSCGNKVVETDRGEQCDPPDGVTCDANCQKITTP